MTVRIESIVNLEHKVWQAVVQQDRATLTALFSDDYVEITLDGQRATKACVVSESPKVDRIRNYSIDSEQAIQLGPDRVLLSYHLAIEGTCRDIEISPADRWATSIWVRTDDSWQCSFFQQSSFDQNNDPATSPPAPHKSIDLKPTKAEVEFLDAQLGEFNSEQTGRNDFKSLQLVKRADDGSVIGCAQGFRVSGGEGAPVLIPRVAVHDGAESGHAVDSTDFPAGAGLFQATADQVFARSFDQAAADCLALG